jgi:hypothetical protein
VEAGSQVFQLGTDAQRDVVMARPVGAAPGRGAAHAPGGPEENQRRGR